MKSERRQSNIARMVIEYDGDDGTGKPIEREWFVCPYCGKYMGYPPDKCIRCERRLALHDKEDS